MLFNYTKGGLLLEMCWNVFLYLLRPSFSLGFVFISIIFASPKNFGRPFTYYTTILSSLAKCLGTKGFLLVSIIYSLVLFNRMTSDVFFYRLYLLVPNKQEACFFSSKLISIWMFWFLTFSSGSWYLSNLCDCDLIVSSSFFLLKSFKFMFV